MFISISRNGDRYSFVVGNSPDDDPRTFFDSAYDFDLVSGMQSDYGSYAEAHAVGQKLIMGTPSAIMARKAVFEDDPEGSSPEDRSVSHFSSQVSLIGERLPSLESMPEGDRTEEAEAIAGELKSIEESIKGVLREVDSSSNTGILDDLLSDVKGMIDRVNEWVPPKPVPEALVDEDVDIGAEPAAAVPPVANPVPPMPQASAGTDVLLAFGLAASGSLAATHRTAHVRSIDRDDPSGSYFVHLADKGGDICSLKFNDRMLLTGIAPSDRVAAVHPYHSVGFMERYWEPISMAVGHFLIPGKDILVSHGHEDSSRFRLAGESLVDGSRHFVSVSKVDGSWWLRDSPMAATKTAAVDRSTAVGKEVRCTRKNLTTYYGRTGMVARVIPRADRYDVVVDFRRGLGTLVLTGEDVEPA